MSKSLGIDTISDKIMDSVENFKYIAMFFLVVPLLWPILPWIDIPFPLCFSQLDGFRELSWDRNEWIEAQRAIGSRNQVKDQQIDQEQCASCAKISRGFRVSCSWIDVINPNMPIGSDWALGSLTVESSNAYRQPTVMKKQFYTYGKIGHRTGTTKNKYLVTEAPKLVFAVCYRDPNLF